LERYLNLHPDAVLMLLYENDITDDRGRETFYDFLPYLKTPDYLLAGVNRGGTPRQTSFLAESRLLRLIEHAIGLPLVTQSGVEPRRLRKLILQNREAQKRLVHLPEQEQASRVAPHVVAASLLGVEWKMSAAYLDYFTEELARRHVPLALSWLSVHLRSEGERRHSDGLSDEITAWAAKRRVPFLSFVPEWLELSLADEERLTLKGDGHPSPEGHRYLADHFQPWLRQSAIAGF
jgi:hypothetical protein